MNCIVDKFNFNCILGSFEFKINFIDENSQLGTAGALKNLETLKHNQDFLIVFGDLLFNFDFKKLINFHKLKKSECTLVVHPNSHPEDSDCVELNDNSQIVEFYKKPHNKKIIINNLCLSGILIINKKFLKLIKPNVSQDISKNLSPRVYLNGRKNLIKRCINNLIDNSIKYANKVNIELSKKNTN